MKWFGDEMDVLAFQKDVIKLKYDEHEVVCAKVLINNTSLVDIAWEYELPYAQKYNQTDIAGGYMPNTAAHLYELLTNKKKSEEYYNKLPILICKCGCGGCLDLLVTIIEDSSVITWTNIHNPHRSSPTSAGGFWDYNGFPRFIFDKNQYKDAVRGLGKMV